MPISAIRWHRRSRMPTAVALTAALGLALSGCGTAATEAGRDADPRASAGAGGGHGGAVRSAVRRLAAQGDAPGAAVLIRREGGGTRFIASGVADVRTGRRIHRSDHFRAGSLTKTVIAAVALRLTAQGRLGLDDPVEEHLPGLVRGHGNDGRNITVRQLLNHTSGLFDYTEDPVLARQLSAAADRTRTPASLVRTALTHRPYFAPGVKWRYSNTNYVLLGMVVQQVTGRSYADEARREVLGPLRLHGTSFPGTRTTLPAPHGRAYTRDSGARGDGARRDVTDLNPSYAGAAGELVSTLDDLSHLLSGLLRGTVVPRAELRQMRDTSASDGQYGMGLFPVRLSCGVTLWGHNGEINGSYALAVATPDGRHTLAYRLNSTAASGLAAETSLLEAEFCPPR
ncbi:D-alanyl-D-alanine carboxypeptidase [Streptomyces melanosporofaciens]|uniref:D-alanyl-D-alanine carboxypeptidase n=2 Tax=Streptomyces melanosporofaciens TaxID=67327 RepID=A0A1H4SH24_STRMJ|nr:D-alanyl-D-alanine carboxypeptidase [Streptomyces melanosporofaciens]